MRIENPFLLEEFRTPGICEWCKKRVTRREPDHAYTRGAGQLDIRVNLIALCGTFTGGDHCHVMRHAGKILRIDLLALVAAREGCLQGDIEEVVWMFRRLPKGANGPDLRGLSRAARKIAKEEWDEYLQGLQWDRRLPKVRRRFIDL